MSGPGDIRPGETWPYPQGDAAADNGARPAALPDVDHHVQGDTPESESQASATAGAPLAPGQPVASQDQVIEALKTVYDPEIPVDIYELGLIYTLDIKPDGDAAIAMSLTAPACPVAGTLPGEVAQAVAAVEGIGRVTVELVWEPPWTMERMSEDAKIALGMG
jgi:FeS assembly SUF system protein